MAEGNKFLLEDKSKLLKTKLEKLSVNLAGGLGNKSLSTQEAYIFEVIRVLREFYKSLNEPQLDRELIKNIHIDDLPDLELYNKIWQQTLDDLITTFAELENVENLTVSSFNFITTESNRLTSRLKAVDSKLGDYILYSLSTDKDAFFFKDSFNDLSKIDINSGLLNVSECKVNQAEGIVTLPIDNSQESFVVIKETPIINPNSNGSIGNNQQLDATYNGNLAMLLDDNPDTWFEYERVILKTADDKEPLTLDITINLGEEKIINHIRVNPNNFGTKTIIQIEEIETSIDGQVYTSIKDDVPIAGFTTEDEENIFSLAPSTSKFAGQGLYTFTPRKVKYVHFIFRQAESYVIDTSAGERLRYAIGLRDIDIRSFTYKSEGEVVSVPFESLREIRKVLLETNQNPTIQSELANINYFISPDDGASWHQLQPKEFDGPSGADAVAEILDFNTGDRDQIVTPIAVKTIRFKAVFKREDDRFKEGSSTLNKRVLTIAELHSVPETSPFTLNLERNPVDKTVHVIDPMFGSRGVPESQYIIGHAQDKLDIRRYRLPFKNFPRPVRKVLSGGSYYTEEVPASEWVHIEVGGEEWTHATTPLDDYTIDLNNLQNFKFFIFNPNNGILEFGDGISNTTAPADNQPITIYFEPERLFPSKAEDNHIAQLDFPTSNNKDDFVIKRYDSVLAETETFPRRATIIRLAQQNIIDTTDITRALLAQGMDATAKSFVNGRDELVNTGDWSIDIEKGIIYTYTPTSGTEDASATYTYQPIIELTTNSWDWADTDLLRDSVQIRDSAWVTSSVIQELPTTQDLRELDLAKLSVVKDTLELAVTVSGIDLPIENSSHPFVKEVDYINGAEELGGEFLQTTENIPTDLVPVANIASFNLKENISTLTIDHSIFFSNSTLFITEVGGIPAAPGEYTVDRVAVSGTYGQVDFYTTIIQTVPGMVTYYFSSPNFSDNGLYSVDYLLGKIFTQRAVDSGGTGAFTIGATFQFTDFRAEYRIARQLDLDAYEVDITNQRVTILDKEILKHLMLPHGAMDNRKPLYLVNYDYVAETREDISDLGAKFSPVLKDFALRVITKGKAI